MQCAGGESNPDQLVFSYRVPLEQNTWKPVILTIVLPAHDFDNDSGFLKVMNAEERPRQESNLQLPP